MLVDLIIRNYKSLRDVHLRDLPPFSVMVGANASGKSNLADALDFLSLVSRSGLAAAVRAKGGYENICFRRARRSKAGIGFDVTARLGARRLRKAEDSGQLLRFQYSFAFRAATEAIKAPYKVTHERFELQYLEGARDRVEVVRESGKALQVTVSPRAERDFALPDAKVLRGFLDRAPVSEDELLWPTWWGGQPFRQLFEFLGGCRVYQISPEMAREPGTPERSPELGRHGDNLPAAVDYLRRSRPDAFEELVSHLRHAVSTMEGLETGYVETKELGLFFRERGVGRRWYAQDVSDGTLKTVSMFLPLLDPRVRMVVIEEPENNLHPWILRHFMDVCKTRASEKQILVTTHSPVAVNEVPVESLFIVRRRSGETEVRRLDAPEAAQVVREELFGLGEYWDSGAIGGVPESEGGVE
jgi:predicted ATPase